jgi:nicotinate-nucleotide adenylyltransferase
MAHLVLAAEALHQLALDKILWLLTLNPPHKTNQLITRLQHRLDMVQAVVDPDPNFELSRIDIDRPPPHFAVDSVGLLREEYPDAALIYLMGSDSLVNLNSWYRPIEFVKRCDGIGVMYRTGAQISDLGSKELSLVIRPKLMFFNTPLIDISATQIRERIRGNRPFRYYVLPQVYKIIEERNLYKNNWDRG